MLWSYFKPLPKSWFNISQSAIIPCCTNDQINICHFITKFNWKTSAWKSSDIFKLWEIVLGVSYSGNIYLCELHQFDWKHTAVYTQKLKIKSDRQCRAAICDDTVLVHGKLFIPIWLNASCFKIFIQRNTSYTINGCKFSNIGDVRKFAGCFDLKSTRKILYSVTGTVLVVRTTVRSPYINCITHRSFLPCASV